jgi:hypothetical protein
MKNFSIRISKAFVGLLALSSIASIGYAETVFRVNGAVCAQPISVTVNSTGTDINVPASCVNGTSPPTCSGTPTISSFSPASGPVGTPISVSGANLCAGATVTINGVAATGVVGNGTSLTAVVATGTTGVGKVAVTTTGNPTATSTTDFTVTTAQQQQCSPGVDCSVEGDVIPSPSRTTPGGNTAARPGKLNGQSPVNAQMNSYAAENTVAKCANATPAITRLWQHNINFGTYQSSGGNDYPFLASNEAMTWKFTAPAEGANQVIQYTEGTQVYSPSAYLTVSDKPCDFDVSKAALPPGTPGGACYKSATNGIELYYRSTTGAVASYECKLVPGQTYYLNLRMQDARPAFRGGSPTVDSCAASGAGLCGGYVQIR